MARSVMPLRTIETACPMACAALAHAVEMVNAGPVIPNSIEMWLAPALAIVLGDGQRMDAVVALLVDFLEARSSVACPPTQEPVTMAAVSRNSGGPFDAGIGHSLARRNHGELCEAVHKIGAAVFEPIRMGNIPSLRRRSESGRWNNPWRESGRYPGDLAQGLRELRRVRPRALMAPAPVITTRRIYGLACASWPRHSRFTPATRSPTPFRLRTSSSGMLMSNSFSSANRIFYRVHGVDPRAPVIRYRS
jgi:hypothetical protein